MDHGTVFIDTWGWLAMGHRREPRHREVIRYYQELRREGRRVVTSDYILDELASLIFRHESFHRAIEFLEGIFAAADQGSLLIERITSARFQDAWGLRRRFHDKPWISFTDLTTMVLMIELGISAVLTEDGHFLQVGMGYRNVP